MDQSIIENLSKYSYDCSKISFGGLALESNIDTSFVVTGAKVACKSRLDCSGDELCMLSGYSDDARGNGDMEATCRAPHGGEEPDPSLVFDPDEIAEGQLPIPPAVDLEAMRDQIAEADIPESFFETPDEPLPAEPE